MRKARADGYRSRAAFKLIAIDEMRHAEMFAERVKELDGEPVTESGGKVQKGQKVQVMFSFDAKLEDNTIDVYNQFAAVCRVVKGLRRLRVGAIGARPQAFNTVRSGSASSGLST